MQSILANRPRSRGLSYPLTWAITALILMDGKAANAASEDPLKEARDLAPALWLGAASIAYPTLPHPFAFDGIDNDEDGCTDLDDPDEIRALVAKHNDSVRRDEVEVLLARLRRVRTAVASGNFQDLHKEVPTPPLTRNCSLTKPLREFKLCRPHDVEGYRCGPDAVLMAAIDRPASSAVLGLSSAQAATVGPIQAIQYWMYYAWDGGHLHDGEHITIFRGEEGIRAAIGAGHLKSTANNVLVAAGETASHIRFPDAVPAHLPFLAELGKHASAPDLNCNGRFDVGQDANDLSSGAWGTRDVNHAIGKSSWTQFQPWTSFDRRAEGLLVEASALSNGQTGKPANPELTRAWEIACPDFSLGQVVLRQRLTETSPAKRRQGSYRLLLASTVQRFLKLAASGTAEQVLGSSDYRDILGLTPEDPLPSQAPDLAALTAWASAGDECDTHPRPDIWNHCDFGRPIRDFKMSLHPRLSVAAVFAAEGGNGKGGLGLRLAGVGPLRDSSLEFQALIDNLDFLGGKSAAEVNRTLLSSVTPEINEGKGHKLELAALYNAFSTSFSGLYFGVSWRPADYSFRRVFQVPNGQVGTDSTYAVLVERGAASWSLEAGYSYRVPIGPPLRVRVGLSGPIFRGLKSTDAESQLRYYQYPNPLDIRISIEWNVKTLVRRRHPLVPK